LPKLREMTIGPVSAPFSAGPGGAWIHCRTLHASGDYLNPGSAEGAVGGHTLVMPSMEAAAMEVPPMESAAVEAAAMEIMVVKEVVVKIAAMEEANAAEGQIVTREAVGIEPGAGVVVGVWRRVSALVAHRDDLDRVATSRHALHEADIVGALRRRGRCSGW
jgi:hypothetical protein